MCFKVKQPKIETPATSLVPETEAKTPESPVYGGTADVYKKRKGKDALKVALTKGSDYNPTNM